MDHLVKLANLRRANLWTCIAVGLYSRQGYMARVQIKY